MRYVEQMFRSPSCHITMCIKSLKEEPQVTVFI